MGILLELILAAYVVSFGLASFVQPYKQIENQDFNTMKEELNLAKNINILKKRNFFKIKTNEHLASKRETNMENNTESGIKNGSATYKSNDSMLMYLATGNENYRKSRNSSIDILNELNFDTKMSPEINKLLEDCDTNKALVDSVRPLPSTLETMLSEKLMVEWTYHSCSFRYKFLTLNGTKAVLDGRNIANKSFHKVKAIQNHQKAIEFVTELAKEKQNLTEVEISKIHSLILAEIEPNNAGRYRTKNVNYFIIDDVVGGPSKAPEYIHVPDLMASLMKWYHQAGDIHPIKRIAIFLARFEMISPFSDGNSRTGLLVANLELMKLGYPPGIIHVQEDILDYFKAIQAACITNDYSRMTTEIVWSVLETLDLYLKALNLHY